MQSRHLEDFDYRDIYNYIVKRYYNAKRYDI